MAIFTVHLPPAAMGEAPAAEKIVFLREGFSLPAFFFGPFWLAWNRAWIAAGAWTLALILVGAIGWALQMPEDAASYLALAMAAALGFEGDRAVAWSLARRGYTESGVVIADNLDEAEEVFFHNWRPAPAGAATAGERQG